jgi:hypothetical protein
MRNKTKLCAQKLNYKLKKEGLIIGTRTIVRKSNRKD